MAELECAYERVCEVFKVSSLYREQIEAIEACISQKNVYASLPTGYGKSMIYFALPIAAAYGNLRNVTTERNENW